MLAAGTAAQAGYSALLIGVSAIAPAIRDDYGLSLEQLGLLLAAVSLGQLVALLPWGLATDRFGERPVLVSGLGLASVALAGCAAVDSFSALFPLVVAAGALGASVNSASGRAVVDWFGPHERGLALGIRQTAIPIGGAFAALALPPLAAADGAQAAFLALAVVLLLGAVAGALALRARSARDHVGEALSWTLRDRRLWTLCAGSALRPRRADRADGIRRALPARRTRTVQRGGCGRSRGHPARGTRVAHRRRRAGRIGREPAAPASGRSRSRSR